MRLYGAYTSQFIAIKSSLSAYTIIPYRERYHDISTKSCAGLGSPHLLALYSPEKGSDLLVLPATNGCIQGRRDDGPDIDFDSLIGTGEAGGEVRDVLAVVGDVLAEELEGDDALLAVLGGADEAENGNVVHGAFDVDHVVAGAEEQILNEQSTDLLVADKVGKTNIALQ